MLRVLAPIQMVVSVALILVILLQARGTGLGSSWGGQGVSYHSKRGMEKILFVATVVLAILFLCSSLINVLGK